MGSSAGSARLWRMELYVPFILLGSALLTAMWLFHRAQSKVDAVSREANAAAHDAIGQRITEIGQRIERMETRMVKRFDHLDSKLG